MSAAMEVATAHVDPDAPFERLALDDTSWVDVSRGWMAGADQLFDTLLNGVRWEPSRLFRYDHFVEERRLGSFWRSGRPLPHPALAEAQRTIQRRYHASFDGFSMIQYRNAADGQAFHRDTDMRWLDDTIIAVLSLGARRPWQLRPRANRYSHDAGHGAAFDVQPGGGDLLVMGGRCQTDWEHSVPYLRTPVGVRISLQWRFARRTGKPFQGASYSAPLYYSSGKRS